MDAGEISPQPVRPLAHVLMGAMDEAAMLAARSENPADREAVMGVLEWIIARLAEDPAR
jgi:hypothetical protein